MRITSTDAINNPGLIEMVKSWAARANIAVKEGSAPIVKVAGPCMHEVRTRRATRGSFGTGNYNFSGGEEFKISSVFIEKKVHADEVVLAVTFVPKSVSLIAEIAGITMELQDALDFFDGMKEWFSEVESVVNAIEEKKEAERPKAVHIPTVAESRASSTWGAW